MNVWTYEEIDYNRRLHLITLFVSLPIALATYPLQVFTFYRLLTRKQTAPIYKLIVINGILGILLWFIHLFTRQLPAFHEFSFIYGFMQEKQVVWIAPYLISFSYTFRIHFAFFIALDRFLTFRPGASQWLPNKRIFNISLVFLFIPLVLGIVPAVFGNYHYVQYQMEDGRVVYRPETRNVLSVAPPILYFLILAICSFLLNGYLIHRLLVLRKEAMISTLNSAKYNASERGLALTSVTTMVAQTIFIVFFLIMLINKSKLAAAINIIPLTLLCAAPFWVLLFTVPTVRRTLPEIGCLRVMTYSWVEVSHLPFSDESQLVSPDVSQ